MIHPTQTPHRLRRQILFAGLATTALIAATAAAAEPPSAIKIPAGSLESALLALSAQTHQQVMYPHELVAGRTAPALSGTYTAEQAIRLLAPADISITRAGPAVLVLRKADASSNTASHPEVAADRPFVAEPAGSPPPEALATQSNHAPPPPSANTVSEVEVTGSHLHGPALSASPLRVLDRDAIDRLGQVTIAEALESLPQNFNGLNTETSRVTTDRLGNNQTYAGGVNLRGLGSNATLVLVNGRRLGGAGAKGDFVDISTLPSIATQRVDVLLDGASAIYGSDAVGGVVNILMRNDFHGVELRVEGGSSDDGKPNEEQFGGIAGRAWEGGGVVAAYEVYRRSALSTADRDFAASSDLRPFGGTDFRVTTAFPGNIVGINPATGVSGPFFAIPTGQNGTGLTASSFKPGTTNLYNQHLGLDLLPDQQRQSAYLAAHQNLGDRVEVDGEALYGFRRARDTQAAPTSTLTVTRADPFFVSPVGATTEQIRFAFDELPRPVARSTEETLELTASAKVRLWGDWRSDSFVSLSQEQEESKATGVLQTAILAEALGNVPDRPQTAFNAMRDGFFNPFAGEAGGNSPTVLAAIGSGFSISRSQSRVISVSSQADGTVIDLPGGALKLAVGGQVRVEHLQQAATGYTSQVAPSALEGTDVERTVGAVFGEARVPLVGAANGRPGVKALELSLAVRWEHYSDFGETTNPKLGVLWTPVDGLNLRASYGRSFRAPGLIELHDSQLYNPISLSAGSSGRIETLLLQGGNPSLRPETADSYTAGFDWRPTTYPGLRLSASYYSVRYQNRIDSPATSSLTTVLTDPAFSAFVRRLNPTNASDLAAINALLASPFAAGALGTFSATDYGAVVDAREVNTGRLNVDGLDVDAGYSLPLLGGSLVLDATGSELFRYDQQLTPTGTILSRLAVVGFPARFHGRVTADWSKGPLSFGAAVNGTSGFHDTLGAHVDALATLDLRARLVGPSDTKWSGYVLSLNVRNVFNTEPPFYNSPLSFAYDGANADVIGRFVSLQFTRRW